MAFGLKNPGGIDPGIALHNENVSSKYIVLHLSTDTKNIYKMYKLDFFNCLVHKFTNIIGPEVYVHLYTM